MLGTTTLTLCAGGVTAQTLSGTSVLFTQTGSTTRSSSSSTSSSAPGEVPLPPGTNLRIEGIPSATQAIDIPIETYSWTENRTGGTARAVPQDFQITLKENLATPFLVLAAASGQRFPRVIVSIRKQGSTDDFVRWTLGDVAISSIQSYTTSDMLIPSNTLTLSYRKINLQIRPVLANGASGAPVRAGWDVLTGEGYE